MKKLLLILAALVLLCPMAFAETENEAVELFPHIGASTREEIQAAITAPFIKAEGVTGGTNMYYGEGEASLCFRYAHKDREENYGWGHETVYYISINMAGYSLNGIRVGDKAEDVDALCIADGWTGMAEPPQNCDGGYEKTVGGVEYTLGYIIEYGTGCINHVHIKAVNV